MSDPSPPKLHTRPRRAAPLQPDQPTRATGAGAADPADTKKGTARDGASVKRQKQRAEAALSNVRDDYD